MHQLVAGAEWLRGAGRVAGAPTGDSAYGAALAPWIRRSQYPASWVFVANQLAARAKTVNVELADTSDDVAQAYQDGRPLPVSGNVRVTFNQSDGFEVAINALAPSLVFLDLRSRRIENWTGGAWPVPACTLPNMESLS